MTESTVLLWCTIEGKVGFFGVSIPLNSKINDLKTEICNTASDSLAGYNQSELNLTKVCYIMISMCNEWSLLADYIRRSMLKPMMCWNKFQLANIGQLPIIKCWDHVL